MLSDDQFNLIETRLTQISQQLAILQTATVKDEPQVFTTKEAMAFLKISHLDTFKSFLKKIISDRLTTLVRKDI